jgi:Holliday junction resolvasome RuvABC endonuclease subunit
VIHPDPEEWVGYARLQLIANGVLESVECWQPKHIFIERPITSGKFNHAIQQQIATLIRDRLYSAGRGWYDVSPTSLKKWAAGTGKAKKKQMAEAADFRWGFKHKSDDIIDGFLLAKMGQVAIGKLPAQMSGVQYGSEGLQA